MSAAANALTNLARAAVTIGVGASVASQAIYDGARRDARRGDATRRDDGERTRRRLDRGLVTRIVDERASSTRRDATRGR